jgi:hypothetical protein
VLALAWVGLMAWNEYRVWNSYLTSILRGFPSFPHDYAQIEECVRPFAIPLSTIWPDGKPFAGWKGRHEEQFPGLTSPPQYLDALGRAHVIVGSTGSKNYLELWAGCLASLARPTFQNTIPIQNSKTTSSDCWTGGREVLGIRPNVAALGL